jgi:membrane protease YdiL (CAAX protease family)
VALLALLVAWGLLVALPFAAPPEEPPVQAGLQARLAGRLARLAVLGEVTEGWRRPLLEEALALVEESRRHLPRDPLLAAQEVLLLQAAGRPEEAGRRLARALQGAPGAPELRWLARPRGEIPAAFQGFYAYQAAELVGQAARLRPAEARKAARDRVQLALVLILSLGNLGAGLLAWLLWPLSRRLLLPAPGAVLPALDLVGAGRWLLLFQLLNLLVVPLLVLGLGQLGLPTGVGVLLCQSGLYLALLAGIARWARGAGPAGRVLGLARPGLRPVVQGLVSFWLAVPLVAGAAWAAARLLDKEPFSTNPALERLVAGGPADRAALVLLTVLLAPFFEEVLFRGLLYPALRALWGPGPAALASSLAFSLVHGDPEVILPLMTLGLVMAGSYERTRSLWPAVLVHALWNGTTVALVLLLAGGV